MHELISRKLFDQQIAGLSERLAQTRNWIFHCLDYPVIDCEFRNSGRTPLRLRFQCNDWNALPPAIELLNADGTALTTLPSNSTNVFNSSAHPITGRPFICMRGSREYHTHSSHTSDSWDNLKGLEAYSLGGILTQIWHAWLKGNG
jgi:hypothetical protein